MRVLTIHEHPPSSFLSRAEKLALVAIAVWGCWLRVRQSGESLWLDELHTSWVVSGSWSEVFHRSAMGNQSPVYFYLVAALTKVLGHTELVLRLPSLVAGGLLPLAVWWLVRRLCGAAGMVAGWGGVLAAWLVAVEPTAIFYAQEARPYALVQLLAVGHLLLLLTLLERPSPAARWTWLLTGPLLFYLHYTAALVLVAEAVILVVHWWIVRDGDASAFTPARAARDGLVMFLLMMPAVFNLAAIYARRHNWELFIPQLGWRELTRMPWTVPWSGAALYAAVAVLVDAWMGRDSRRAASLVERRRLFVWLFVLAWLVVPVGIVATTTAADWLRLWHVRYVVASLPAALVLAALLPRLVPGRGGVFVALSMAAAAGWISHQSLDWSSVQGFSQRREGWREAVEFLNEELPAGSLLLVRSGLIEADSLRTVDSSDLAAYCSYPVRAMYALSDDIEIVPLPNSQSGRFSADVRDALRRRKTATVVLRGSSGTVERVVGSMRDEWIREGVATELERQESFGRVHIWKLRIE